MKEQFKKANMDEAQKMCLIMLFIILLMGVLMFNAGAKVFAIGIFAHVILLTGFTILFLHNKYWWSAIVFAIWLTISYLPIASIIGKWLEKKLEKYAN